MAASPTGAYDGYREHSGSTERLPALRRDSMSSRRGSGSRRDSCSSASEKAAGISLKLADTQARAAARRLSKDAGALSFQPLLTREHSLEAVLESTPIAFSRRKSVAPDVIPLDKTAATTAEDANPDVRIFRELQNAIADKKNERIILKFKELSPSAKQQHRYLVFNHFITAERMNDAEEIITILQADKFQDIEMIEKLLDYYIKTIKRGDKAIEYYEKIKSMGIPVHPHFHERMFVIYLKKKEWEGIWKQFTFIYATFIHDKQKSLIDPLALLTLLIDYCKIDGFEPSIEVVLPFCKKHQLMPGPEQLLSLIQKLTLKGLSPTLLATFFFVTEELIIKKRISTSHKEQFEKIAQTVVDVVKASKNQDALDRLLSALPVIFTQRILDEEKNKGLHRPTASSANKARPPARKPSFSSLPTFK